MATAPPVASTPLARLGVCFSYEQLDNAGPIIVLLPLNESVSSQGVIWLWDGKTITLKFDMPELKAQPVRVYETVAVTS